MATRWVAGIPRLGARALRTWIALVSVALSFAAGPAGARADGPEGASTLGDPLPVPSTRGAVAAATAEPRAESGIGTAAGLATPKPGLGTTQPSPGGGSSRVAFDLALGTHLPLSVGGEATLELPGRLLAQLHVGWLAPAYVDLINHVATGRGWYDPEEAAVIESVVEDAYVIRPALGWRPLPDHGLELFLGYTHLRLGGDTTPAELRAAGVADEMPGDRERIALGGRLHGLTVAVGWRFLPTDHLVIRAGLGYTRVLGAHITVDSPSEAANRRAARELESELIDDVQTLELRLTLGWRL